MAGPLYLILTGQDHLTWPCLQMPPVPLAPTILATGLLNLSHPSSRTAPFSGNNFFPIALACLLWGHLWSGRKILFHCDNQPVVDMWASGTSRDPNTMHLVRSIFFCGATHNFTVNSIADSLSRLQMARFRQLAPAVASAPTPIPPSAQTLLNVA